MSVAAHRRVLPAAPARRGWCPGLSRPMPTGDGLLARVHPPLGILTLPQARAVAEGARRFGNGHLDLTARANLQIRGVSEATRAPLARLLEAAGLGDTRADGGPQRLTLTSPLAGHDPAETFDVPALARAIEAAGLAVPGLPAKTLVVVEGRPGAQMPDADACVFSRASGGFGIAVAAERGFHDLATCAEDEAPAATAAVLEAFARSGLRRMRDLSSDAFSTLADAVREELQARVPSPVRERDKVSDATSPESAPPSPHPSSAWERGHGGVTPDVAPFSPPAGIAPLAASQIVLTVDAPFGRCTADALDRLVDLAARLGAEEIRLSPARGFVLLLPAAPQVDPAALADDFIVAPDDPRRSVAACTGAPACASGSTPTLSDAASVAEAFRPFAVGGSAAHVSGCAKGCARPGPADLTLVGRDGLYGAVIGGAPGDEPAMHLPIEAVLERLGRAETIGLAAAFAPDRARTEIGRTRRPA
ncbi:precorrin-3B synthase [Methylobacterium sp. ARG-1]|uniref:precorrin-3B synthase n=1 Tax=Methylobacterium sp. ARG-1 TaxID=1692501 RepID=UPI000680D4CA|nr:precorrin-3B synthase [Methylobacterium sp. ARG-1]KNY23004.1 precorrin-3B synthase [Methylobacterium sp. ARG-1]